MSKIPFILVTGFLGSGKTTLLGKFLSDYSTSRRILLIQNEFAASSIDGEQLSEQGFKFSLLEINRGSVFCVCLFSDFKRLILEQIEASKPDMIVLEATGVADPIAIGQLLNDPQIGSRMFLLHIWCVVDAANLLQVKEGIRSIPNQIRVADSVVVNKCDRVTPSALEQIDAYIKTINPYAQLTHTSFCQVDFGQVLNAPFRLEPIVERNNMVGALTRCDQRELTSQVIKSNVAICQKQLIHFLATLTPGVIRLKGFVKTLDAGVMMVQYVSGDYTTTPLPHRLLTTELIAITSDSCALSYPGPTCGD